MTAALVLPDLSTPDAYVAWVEQQSMKYEMTGGRLVMMAGGSHPHATIAGNIFAMLWIRLRGQRCQPYNADFMVEITLSDRFYPDVTVACDETRDFTDRPAVIVEVLSASTERFDRTVKLPRYLAKAGLRHVLFLAQDRPHAWLFRPDQPEGDVPFEVTALAESLNLPDLRCVLPMSEIYERINFT